jgi:hypothetical protein
MKTTQITAANATTLLNQMAGYKRLTCPTAAETEWFKAAWKQMKKWGWSWREIGAELDGVAA